MSRSGLRSLVPPSATEPRNVSGIGLHLHGQQAGLALKSWFCDFLTSCMSQLKIQMIWRRAPIVLIPMQEKSLGDSKSYRQGCSGVGTLGNGVPTPFCTSNITWRYGIQTIIFKHGCVLTDVLATRRFALLDKSKQLVKKSTNRKIQCGNSRRRIVTWFKLFGVVFLHIWCGNAQAR